MSMIIQEVGDYLLTEEIGQGGYGTVYLAHHKKTKELVAVKKIPTKTFTKKEFDALETERKTLKIFNHPNILKLYHCYHSKRHTFFVTEYCSGGDLFELMRKKKKSIEESTLKKIIFEIATGLKEIHRNHVIHRDLKPENILLTDDGSVKIADFGLSRFLDENDLAKTCCGTLYFMAPEIILGTGHDSRVDLWSLGALWYENVYKTLPISGVSPDDYRKQIKNTTIQFGASKNHSKESIELIKKLLEKNPEKRLTLDELLQDDYFKSKPKEEIIQEEVVETGETTPACELLSSQYLEEEFVFIDDKDLEGLESNESNAYSCNII